jgi:hypothetical protein
VQRSSVGGAAYVAQQEDAVATLDAVTALGAS